MSKHIHILGVCGTFMGSLAVIAKQKGYKVTGSDLNIYPPMSTYLESQGVTVIKGFDCSQLDDTPDEIIIGNVMKRGEPIIEKILDERFNYFSGPEWLYENILQHKKVIALSGTHGKTTTTTMTVKILEEAGLNPGFLIGGISGDFGVSSRYTDSEYFVIEADEYDTAFFDKRSKLIHYDPSILVINNIEYDHSDIFRNIDAIYWQFHQLIRRMPSKSKIIYNSDDINVQNVIDMGCWSELISMDSLSGYHVGDCARDYSKFTLVSDTCEKLDVSWDLIGEHNAQNALCAYAVARQLGVSDENIESALRSFKGIKRRLEILHKSEIVTLYDDFAHHPTSIKLTLEAVKNKNPKSFVIGLLDPRSNTMRHGDNKENLPRSLLSADKILLYDHELLEWDAQMLLSKNKNVEYVNDIDGFVGRIESILSSNADKKIEVVMMSNGSFDGLRERLVNIFGAL